MQVLIWSSRGSQWTKPETAGQLREREHAKHKTAVAPSGEHPAKRFLRQDLRFCKAMVAAGYRWHGES
jgi:hypothetical protein